MQLRLEVQEEKNSGEEDGENETRDAECKDGKCETHVQSGRLWCRCEKVQQHPCQGRRH